MSEGDYFEQIYSVKKYYFTSIFRAYNGLCFIDILYKPSINFYTAMFKNDAVMVKICTNIKFH